MCPRRGMACALALAFAIPIPVAAQCRERPTVFTDEKTAEGHLLAKRDLYFPKAIPNLAQIRKVTVVVTVDRTGTICDAEAVAGPGHLRSAAVERVRKHWRFRPFLVDWKTVVIQFPVSVKFVLADRGPSNLARFVPAWVLHPAERKAA